MAHYLTEQNFNKFEGFVFAYRAMRLNMLSAEATARGRPMRAAMLNLMHRAYVLAGIAFYHRLFGQHAKSIVLSADADDRLEEARDAANGAVTAKGTMEA